MRTKLWLTFGVMVGALLVVVLVAISAFNSLVRQTQAMADRRDAAERQTAEMVSAFYQLDGAMNMYLLVPDRDSQAVSDAHDTYTSGVERFQSARDALVPLLEPGTEQDLMAQIDVNFAGYRSYVDKVDAALATDDMPTAIQAQTIDNNDVSNALMDALDKLAAEQRTNAAAAADQSVATGEASTRLVAMVGVVAALGALGIVVALSRLLSGEVRRLSEATGRLALGDIDQSIELRGKDELGEMAGNLRAVLEYLQAHAATAEAIANGELSMSRALRPRRSRPPLRR